MIVLFLKLLQFIYGLIFRLPAPAAIYLMHLAGEITFQIARLTPVKKATTANFQKIFPQANAGQLADRLLQNTAYSIFELLCLPFFQSEHFALTCKVVGQENLDLALAPGKGGLLLTMHTGNYELTPAILSHFGYKITSIVKAPPGPLFELINRCRTSQGSKQINVLDSNMYRDSMKLLSDNELIGLLLDTGALESRNEQIEFLERKVLVATGWLALAQRSEASAFLAICQRQAGKLVFTFEPPFTIGRNDKAAVLARIKDYFERIIQAHPEQWAMFLNEDEVKRMVEGK